MSLSVRRGVGLEPLLEAWLGGSWLKLALSRTEHIGLAVCVRVTMLRIWVSMKYTARDALPPAHRKMCS